MSSFAKGLLKIAADEAQDYFKKNKASKSDQNTSTGMSGYNQPYNPNGQPGYNQPYGQGGAQPSGYNPYGQAGQAGYPQSGYGQPYGQAQPGYPAPQPGYPPSQPSSQPSYPPSQPGYPQAQSGYPPSQPGYPPSQPAYPPAQSAYPGPSPTIGFNVNPGQYPPAAGGPSYPPTSYPAFGQGYQQQPGLGQPYGQTMYSTPSIKPDPSANPQHDAETLRKAMKGLGCNNNKVIQVLCTRSNAQRQQIALAFKQMYGKDLLSELKSELHGDFENLILALMENPVKYDADQLHKAMAGLGTRESVLIEIMTTRTNAQIQQLKQVYRQLYGHELEGDLAGETSGHFKRLLVSLCTGQRDESGQVDQLRANQDARGLYRAGEQRLGTDESKFNQVLASQSFGQLRLVFDEYQRTSGHSIEQAVGGEFSGDVRDGLLAIIQAVRSRAAFFAHLLHEAMRGMGTRDGDLIRVVVTRSEIDLADVRAEYQRMFGTSLESAIKGDCSGSYKDGLIALVKGN